MKETAIRCLAGIMAAASVGIAFNFTWISLPLGLVMFITVYSMELRH